MSNADALDVELSTTFTISSDLAHADVILIAEPATLVPIATLIASPVEAAEL